MEGFYFFIHQKDERMVLICLQLSKEESNFIVPLEKDKLIYLQPSKHLDRLRWKQKRRTKKWQRFFESKICLCGMRFRSSSSFSFFTEILKEDEENVTKQLGTIDENSFAWKNLQLNSRVEKRFWSVGWKRLKVKIDALKVKTSQLGYFVALKSYKINFKAFSSSKFTFSKLNF